MPAHAQQASAAGTTTIVDQFSLTQDSPLAFGSVLPPTAGSNSVIINEVSGARTLDGGGDAQLVGTGASRATFTVEGEGGQDFNISVGTLVLTRDGGSETIAVTLVPSATTGTLSGSAGSGGTATFGIGGSFTVDSSTLVGFYEGSFTVSVDNN